MHTTGLVYRGMDAEHAGHAGHAQYEQYGQYGQYGQVTQHGPDTEYINIDINITMTNGH